MNPGPETSVVIQGPIHGSPTDPPERQLTQRVIASVRRHMPGAEVIVSTWKGSPTEHLGADLVVSNEDPGAITLNDDSLSGYSNNLNRQLVSTQSGLRLASRKYAIKLRTDTLVERPIDIKGIADKKPVGRWGVFRGQVAVLNLYTRHPLKRPVLFHLSDLFHAGLREDLLILWDIPLVDEPGFTRTIDPRRRPLVNVFNSIPQCETLFRAAPEQYLGESLCRRLDHSVRLRHVSDARIRWLELWLSVLASNFRILTFHEAGILPPARMARDSSEWDLFQPEDSGPLLDWSTSNVSVRTRCRVALLFLRLRWPYVRAGLIRKMPPKLAVGIHRVRRKLRWTP